MLGRARFAQETGIRVADWEGKLWARWNDAVREAGLTPNELTTAYPREFLLGRLAQVVRELGYVPSYRELRLMRRTDASVPNEKVFQRLAGTKAALCASLVEYCHEISGFDDVISIAALCAETDGSDPAEDSTTAPIALGEVYLIKAGRFHKIGMSVSADRRYRQLRIQLPEKSELIHTIRTDDPTGIERYWHDRFSAKRQNGEWFKLDASDIAAFRRRKTM